MNTFKTPKGTELPFLNLKGKDYLQVAHRIVWFREDHPDWVITTNIHTLNADVAIISCEIKDKDQKVLAMAHKMQTAKGFPGGYLEKAESGAVGRALAFLGYGTAFAQELEENISDVSNMIDSPIAKNNQGYSTTVVLTGPLSTKNDKTITFGKYKGKKMSDVKYTDLLGYAEWLDRNAKETKKPLSKDAAEFIRAVDAIPATNTPSNHAMDEIPF